MNSGKVLTRNNLHLGDQIEHDLITRYRSYNYYIKIFGKYLVASTPSNATEVSIYKQNSDNGPEYDNDGNPIEYGNYTIPEGLLLIYDLENNKVILDKKYVSMLNLNDDGVFYGGQFLDTLQEFSFIKWNGEYSFQNLKLSELFQDKEKLKTIIGNCNNIYDVKENLPFDLMKFFQGYFPSFRYTAKNGNSGYFDFSGVHEVFENKTVFSPKFYVESGKLKHKNNITFEFPTFKITEAFISIDLAYDEYGNEYNDTIHFPIDTILVESRTCDTILSADNYIGTICLDHYSRIYATLADKHEYLNSNLNSNKTDYRFLNDFNALIKRNKSIFYNQPETFHIHYEYKIECEDPSDPTTCYQVLDNETGEQVIDWNYTYVDRSDAILHLYDIETKKIHQYNNAGFCAQNEDGVLLLQKDFFRVNNSKSEADPYYLYNPRGFKKAINYLVFDTLNSKTKDKFDAGSIISNPDKFIASFLNSSKFKIIETLWQNDYILDTVFLIKYEYKGKERIISNSQKIIDFSKKYHFIKIGETIFHLEKNKPYYVIADTIEVLDDYEQKNWYRCKKSGKYYVISKKDEVENSPVLEKPDSNDPSTWYETYDEFGNVVYQQFVTSNGYTTILDEKFNSVYNSDAGIQSEIGNCFLLCDSKEKQYDNGNYYVTNTYTFLSLTETPGKKNHYDSFDFSRLAQNGFTEMLFPNNLEYHHPYDLLNEESNLLNLLSNFHTEELFSDKLPKPLNAELSSLVLPSKSDESYGLINLNGQKLTPFEFDEVKYIIQDDKSYYILSDENKTSVYDLKGKLVKSFPKSKLFFIRENKPNEFSNFNSIILKDETGYYRLKSMESNIKNRIADSLFSYKLIKTNPDEYEDGVYKGGYHLKNHFGYYKGGKWFEEAIGTGKGWILKDESNEMYSYVLKSGEEIPGVFERIILTGRDSTKNIFLNSENYLIVKRKIITNDIYAAYDFLLYDINGKLVFPDAYQNITEEGLDILKLEDTVGYRLYNTETKKLSPLMEGYDNWYRNKEISKGMMENGKLAPRFKFKDPITSKYGLMDSGFNIILSPEYDAMSLHENRWFYTVKDNIGRLHDSTGKILYPNAIDITKAKDIATGYTTNDYFIIKENKKHQFIGPKQHKMYEADSFEYAVYSSDDNFIRIKTNKNFVLLDSSGNKILERDYYLVLAFEKGYAMYTTKNLNERGVINEKGEEVIPAVVGQTFFVDQEKPFYPLKIYNGTLAFSDSIKGYGLIDVTNKIILQPQFESMGTLKDGVFSVLNEDGWGVVDYTGKKLVENKHRWIFEPDSLGNIKIKHRIVKQKGKLLDTTLYFGMYDSNFREIIPYHLDYYIKDYIKGCDCYPLSDKNGDNYFYLVSQNIITNDPKKSGPNEFIQHSLADEKINFSAEWKQLSGLTSRNVSSFYEDKKGNWWAGAGTRGGMYFSDDKGTTWGAKNNGLGASNITLIGSVNGKVTIEEAMDNIHQLSDNNEWEQIPDSLEIGYRDSLLISARENFNTLNQLLSLTWSDDSDVRERRPSQETDWFLKSNDVKSQQGKNSYNYYYSHFNSDFYKYTQLVLDTASSNYSENGTSKQFLPITALRSGNFFRLRSGQFVMIGNRGIHEIDSNGKILRALAPEFETAVIKKLIRKDDKTIFSLTDDDRIWKLNGNTWKLLFDMETHLLDKKSDLPVSYQNIGEIYMDGNYLNFEFRNSVYQLDSKGKLTVLVPDTTIETDYYTEEYKIKSALHTKTGIMGIALRGNYPVFFRYKNNNIHVIKEFSSYTQSCIVKDPNGEIWVKTDGDYLVRFINDSTFKDTVSVFPDNNSINMYKTIDGKLCFMDGFLIHTFNPENHKWTSHYSHAVMEAGYLPINDFCIDKSGNEYLATGHSIYNNFYRFYLEYYQAGLFKISFDGKHYTLKEMYNSPDKWVTQVVPYKNGLLAGTSGSGVWYVETKK